MIAAYLVVAVGFLLAGAYVLVIHHLLKSAESDSKH
jgi:hypothetical protein